MYVHNMYVLGRFDKSLDVQFGTDVEKADWDYDEKTPCMNIARFPPCRYEIQSRFRP